MKNKKAASEFPAAYAPQDDFVSIAAPALNLLLRLRAGLETLSMDLHAAFEKLLAEMDKAAAARRYREAHMNDVKFALVVFIDETVLELSMDTPLYDEWESNKLQHKYLRTGIGGVEFDKRLNRLLDDPESEAAVIEVYYLCLLLGYRGDYFFEDELKRVTERAAERLTEAGRLGAGELSPHWSVSDQPPVQRDAGVPAWVKVGAATGLGLVVLTFIVFTFLLNSGLSEAKEALLR
ncbi:MAG TPA: DotU family type IV/VI secretion system protein [Pyrinomonadaceae bacterium]|jgi:type VI secretion system protein ImpK